MILPASPFLRCHRMPPPACMANTAPELADGGWRPMSARDLLAALPVELIGAAQQAVAAEGFHNALEGLAGGAEQGAEREEDEEEEEEEEGDEDEEVTAAAHVGLLLLLQNE